MVRCRCYLQGMGGKRAPCYGIVQVPTGPWFCRKCESQERAARVILGGTSKQQHTPISHPLPPLGPSLCSPTPVPLTRSKAGWAHVVCALYIPEVEFANVSTMEPIVLQSVPHDRYNKTCYICEDQGRESKAATGACMTCNKHGCRQAFHVTCAQFAGLLCEEQGSDADNVKYCGYCKYHHSKLKHKERDRHKPKHKKVSMDMSPSLVLPNILVPDKTYISGSSVGGVASLPASSQKRLDDGTSRFTTANFQEVSSALSGGGSKDCSAAEAGKVASEAKNKKNSAASHVAGQRGGRKSLATSGKPLPSAVVTMATSSTSASASTGPFHQDARPFCVAVITVFGLHRPRAPVIGGPFWEEAQQHAERKNMAPVDQRQQDALRSFLLGLPKFLRSIVAVRGRDYVLLPAIFQQLPCEAELGGRRLGGNDDALRLSDWAGSCTRIPTVTQPARPRASAAPPATSGPNPPARCRGSEEQRQEEEEEGMMG
ncbi:Protein AF-10 [Liparis tanakae]|uniref:Protein AF-10 n=1 Tax=Liparis tanakae TaxID=230148 RepID=A0A4Z2H3N4_9TELE|nr:Protein AF-10 [Liparis tanakae]